MGMLSRVFTAIGNKPSSSYNKHLPMINSVTHSFESYLSEHGQVGKKRALMRWYRNIPELTGLLGKVAKDIVSPYTFVSINHEKVNRNKILKANRFAQEILLKKTLYSQVIDILVTGEGFGWIGKFTDSQVKDKIKESVRKEIFMSVKEKNYMTDRIFNEIKAIESIDNEKYIDEDLLTPRKYKAIASSTMEIIHDQYDIMHYNHIVGTNRNLFTPKEIIRFNFGEIDGKPYGFTPVESVIVQLELLRQMWQNMLSLHKNGGSPDKLFILEDVNPKSPSYKRIEEQLSKYQLVENKHGNMLFTGKVSVQDLQQIDKMQFMDSGLYITGLIAMQWGIPRSSIPYIVGGTNTKDDTGGNSERGYWDNIEFAQSLFADVMNTQLWIPHFGVKIKFEKTFINKDLQMQTAKNMELNNIKLMNEILIGNGKTLKESFLCNKLDVTKEDIEEKEIEMDIEGMGNNAISSQVSDSDTSDGDDKKNIKKKKKNEQDSINSRNGEPNGVTKEWDKATELEFKETLGSDIDHVDLKTFVRIYNQDKAYNPGMAPRVFVRENLDYLSYKFKSSDFVYKTVINKSEIELNEIRVMLRNISDNLFRV